MKISILGAGELGSHIALLRGIQGDFDITLLGRNLNKTMGHAMDLNQAYSCAQTESVCNGTINPEEIKDSHICIITSGVRRKPGMQRGDLFSVNAQIVTDDARKIMKYCPHAWVLVMTNPLDAMTHQADLILKNPRKVLGVGNTLDTARYKEVIRSRTGKKRKDIQCLVTGGRDYDDQKHEYSEQTDTLIKESKQIAIKTIELKGATVFAPALAANNMIDSILYGGYTLATCKDTDNESYYGRMIKIERDGIVL